MRSIVLDRAATRAAAIASIADPLDLGNELTLASYRDTVADTRSKLDRYNTLLSDVDEARAELETAEIALSEASERMLRAIGVRYGRASNEYVKAGGVRKVRRPRFVAVPDAPETSPEADAA